MIGGYKIIDFKRVAIPVSAGTPVVIPGIYDAIESSYKALLCENVSVDVSGTVTEYKPFFAFPKLDSDDYIITVFASVDDTTGVTERTLIINDDDEVVYADNTYVASEEV